MSQLTRGERVTLVVSVTATLLTLVLRLVGVAEVGEAPGWPLGLALASTGSSRPPSGGAERMAPALPCCGEDLTWLGAT